MQTDLTDDEYERLGRETAGRLGVEPRWYLNKWCCWDGTDLPRFLRDVAAEETIDTEFDTAGQAYIALGRAVHACRLAVGYYDAVVAERERAAKILDDWHDSDLNDNWIIAEAIRKGARHD